MRKNHALSFLSLILFGGFVFSACNVGDESPIQSMSGDGSDGLTIANNNALEKDKLKAARDQREAELANGLILADKNNASEERRAAIEADARKAEAELTSQNAYAQNTADADAEKTKALYGLVGDVATGVGGPVIAGMQAAATADKRDAGETTRERLRQEGQIASAKVYAEGDAKRAEAQERREDKRSAREEQRDWIRSVSSNIRDDSSKLREDASKLQSKLLSDKEIIEKVSNATPQGMSVPDYISSQLQSGAQNRNFGTDELARAKALVGADGTFNDSIARINSDLPVVTEVLDGANGAFRAAGAATNESSVTAATSKLNDAQNSWNSIASNYKRDGFAPRPVSSAPPSPASQQAEDTSSSQTGGTDLKTSKTNLFYDRTGEEGVSNAFETFGIDAQSRDLLKAFKNVFDEFKSVASNIECKPDAKRCSYKDQNGARVDSTLREKMESLRERLSSLTSNGGNALETKNRLDNTQRLYVEIYNKLGKTLSVGDSNNFLSDVRDARDNNNLMKASGLSASSFQQTNIKANIETIAQLNLQAIPNDYGGIWGLGARKNPNTPTMAFFKTGASSCEYNGSCTK